VHYDNDVKHGFKYDSDVKHRCALC